MYTYAHIHVHPHMCFCRNEVLLYMWFFCLPFSINVLFFISFNINTYVVTNILNVFYFTDL